MTEEQLQFQCSSASRKFLKEHWHPSVYGAYFVFQCSSASRKFLKRADCFAHQPRHHVSVLFSEPKIPQSFVPLQRLLEHVFVSVLFSEPKIPQTLPEEPRSGRAYCFSALQRAENSSKVMRSCASTPACTFQCSSASRKFLKRRPASYCWSTAIRFSALQRAENSSN